MVNRYFNSLTPGRYKLLVFKLISRIDYWRLNISDETSKIIPALSLYGTTRLQWLLKFSIKSTLKPNEIISSLTRLPLVPHICISQWIGSALVQIMACCLIQPPSHYLNQCWVIMNMALIFSEILVIKQLFQSIKCIWKYHLRNVDHFVQGEDELNWHNFIYIYRILVHLLH